MKPGGGKGGIRASDQPDSLRATYNAARQKMNHKWASKTEGNYFGLKEEMQKDHRFEKETNV